MVDGFAFDGTQKRVVCRCGYTRAVLARGWSDLGNSRVSKALPDGDIVELEISRGYERSWRVLVAHYRGRGQRPPAGRELVVPTGRPDSRTFFEVTTDTRAVLPKCRGCGAPAMSLAAAVQAAGRASIARPSRVRRSSEASRSVSKTA